ncbi:hypothetical protein BaRGS_00039051 [Batillaria attramentaria]|uniref:Uncharacterized protein n=1 Tax=Batillaria attramentaria TaxID=370345 RepID=A0ABD0J4P0_9CAEN
MPREVTLSQRFLGGSKCLWSILTVCGAPLNWPFAWNRFLLHGVMTAEATQNAGRGFDAVRSHPPVPGGVAITLTNTPAHCQPEGGSRVITPIHKAPVTGDSVVAAEDPTLRP